MLPVNQIKENILNAPDDVCVRAGHILMAGFVVLLLVKIFLLPGIVFTVYPALCFLGAMYFYFRVISKHVKFRGDDA